MITLFCLIRIKLSLCIYVTCKLYVLVVIEDSKFASYRNRCVKGKLRQLWCYINEMISIYM